MRKRQFGIFFRMTRVTPCGTRRAPPPVDRRRRRSRSRRRARALRAAARADTRPPCAGSRAPRPRHIAARAWCATRARPPPPAPLLPPLLLARPPSVASPPPPARAPARALPPPPPPLPLGLERRVAE